MEAKDRLQVGHDTEEEEVSWGSGAVGGEPENNKKAVPPPIGRQRGSSGPSGRGTTVSSVPCCQAERCGADLSDAKKYHRRHKVCEVHSKAAVVLVAGFRQRFCQQCSRFHELSEFDDVKRSCRRRLAGHNERRRKNSVECYVSGETSNAKTS